MAPSPQFAEHLRDLFAALGPPFEDVRVARMFGGLGVYCDGVMFALVSKGVLHFKTDGQNRAAFEAAGGKPLVYMKAGRPIEVAYLTVPDGDQDDPAALAPWARLAFDAALRARKPARRRG